MRVWCVVLCVLCGFAAGQKSFLSEDEIQSLPDCDDRLLKSRPRSAVSDDAFEWFCPNSFPLRDIEAYRCTSGSCVTVINQIGNVIMKMGDCRQLLSYESYRRRVFNCMPWEVDPYLHPFASQPLGAVDVPDDGKFRDRSTTGMWHLHAQFPSFRAVRQWYEIPANDQSARVPRCEPSTVIGFSVLACWHADSEVVVLKPSYKFKVKSDGNKEFCGLSSSQGSEASYNDEKLIWYPLEKYMDRAYTRCKYSVSNAYKDKFDFDIANDRTGVEWKFKDIDFENYNLEKTTKACPDAVTAACVDNVFSFYAKECVWVRTSKNEPLSLKTMLGLLAPVDRESFVSYANNQQYVLNLGQRNVLAWVDNEPWDGQPRYLNTDTASLRFMAKPEFSCDGCAQPGQALAAADAAANADNCGVPQACVKCEPWQRVDTPWRSSWSRCDPSFPIRKCADCAVHHVRSNSTEKGADELCVPCDALTPMRRVDQTACTRCEHTQWFDATSAAGCVYFMSVADGLSFVASPPAKRFDAAYVDQYRPAGSTRRPEAVPALYYRNLVSDGDAWTTSTSVEMCPPSSFGSLNAQGTIGLTRNVYGRQVQFRRWCGHAEILKADDALMWPLDCGSRRPANQTSLSELVAGAVSYKLAKERRLVNNRMAEVKLTILSDGFSCFYELRREGRAENCLVCVGTMYTKDCGPTYLAELSTPAVAGPGTCAPCEEQCSLVSDPESYFAVTQFSCWSNGTARVQGSGLGSLKSIKIAMSASINFWYKPAACVKCAKLSGASVPQIVTRCGNKAWFKTWHPTDRLVDEALVTRPREQFCCAIDRNKNVSTICQWTLLDLGLTSASPLCDPFVPDLATSYDNFCPPGWFLDRTAPGCGGVLTDWSRSCCKECEKCEGAGKIQTDKFVDCSGGTDYDTQLKGCVTTCAEKNYLVGNKCIACESCA